MNKSRLKQHGLSLVVKKSDETEVSSPSLIPNTPEIINSLISLSNGINCDSTKVSMTKDGMRSKLIKEGLKLTLQSRRARTPSDTASSSHTGDEQDSGDASRVELTAEDEERRRARRERNKLAASKCRIKKKEQIQILDKECEKLSKHNSELKAKIDELKFQKNTLEGILFNHRPSCSLPKNK